MDDHDDDLEFDLPEPERQRILHDYVENNVTDAEDISIVESVHRGMKSMGFTGGRFAVADPESHAAEVCVHRFQAIVREALEGRI